jgi:SRSO17 transposase
MLPQIRNGEYLFSIPKFDIKKEDVEDFHNELRGFHDVFRECFSRSESRDHFFKYMVGQFSELERKSIEPIALAVEEGNVRTMQHFVSDVVWDDEMIMRKYHSMVADDLGDPDGVLIFDETGFIKKGDDSVGVNKQYCGEIGKVENCQVGVFAAYASPQGYALVDKRLFIPEKWFTDAYAGRRSKCGVSEDMAFMSKPQLAAQMLEDLVEQSPFAFRWVVADSIYGSSPDFINAVENCPDLRYFVSVPCDIPCWLTAPITRKKQYRYRGQIHEKTVLESTEKRPIAAQSLAQSIHDVFWYRRTVSEGAKGPIEYEFTKRRVVLSKNDLPDRTVWLIIRRTIGAHRTYRYFISNAPMSTRLPTFVWLSGLRWPIEQCFEETKTELGMDHYEVRKYAGWHHHILTCMLAHFFLWHLKIRLGKKSTVYYGIAAYN